MTNRLTLFEIASNRPLLAKMTLEDGEWVPYEQQLDRLAAMIRQKPVKWSRRPRVLR